MNAAGSGRLRLHGYPVSNYFNIARAALIEKRAQFDVVTLRASQESEFLKKSPMGKIPVLETSNGWIAETVAILEYIEETIDGPYLYPPDYFLRARGRQIINVVQMYVEAQVRSLFPGVFFGQSNNDATLTSARQMLDRATMALTQLMKPQPFLLGAALSHADVFAFYCLDIADRVTRFVYSRSLILEIGGLTEWSETMANRASSREVLADFYPAFKTYLTEHKAQYNWHQDLLDESAPPAAIGARRHSSLEAQNGRAYPFVAGGLAEKDQSMYTYRMLVGGELLDAKEHMPVISPVTETVIGQAPSADNDTIDDAVLAAAKAYITWRSTTHAERRSVVLAISAALAEHGDELVRLLVHETGRPLAIAQFELGLARQFLDYYAEQQLNIEVLAEDDSRRVELHRKSLGVIAAIVPWNAPLYLAVNKIAPALMAGNTIVVKTAPTAPLTMLRLGELILKAVPAGLVNIVSGGNDAGANLVAHPSVAKVSFTGSTQTGRAIMASAATSLKRLTLELGGNDAAIVLPDADPKSIAPALFAFAFFNSGQVCAVIKRLYVHTSIYDAVCEEIATLAKSATVGDGMDPSIAFGPIQNRAQYMRVLGYLEDARAHGNIIAGGERRKGPGFFVPLTIVRDIADGTATVDEEVFGPILPIIRYSEIDDAIARANSSPYGLGASVWSRDTAKAAAVAKRLESGTVWINQHCALDPAVPFPAHKQSGIGVESGREGLLAYTALQVININKAAAA